LDHNIDFDALETLITSTCRFSKNYPCLCVTRLDCKGVHIWSNLFASFETFNGIMSPHVISFVVCRSVYLCVCPSRCHVRYIYFETTFWTPGEITYIVYNSAQMSSMMSQGHSASLNIVWLYSASAL